MPKCALVDKLSDIFQTANRTVDLELLYSSLLSYFKGFVGTDNRAGSRSTVLLVKIDELFAQSAGPYFIAFEGLRSDHLLNRHPPILDYPDMWC